MCYELEKYFSINDAQRQQQQTKAHYLNKFLLCFSSAAAVSQKPDDDAISITCETGSEQKKRTQKSHKKSEEPAHLFRFVVFAPFLSPSTSSYTCQKHTKVIHKSSLAFEKFFHKNFKLMLAKINISLLLVFNVFRHVEKG